VNSFSVPEQLSLTEHYQYTFATNQRIAQQKSGLESDEEPTEFTAFYHRKGGIEKDVLVQDVTEIIEESKWNPLQEEGFERVAHLLEEDTSSPIPVGETEDGEIHELADGTEGPVVSDRVQIQLRQE